MVKLLGVPGNNSKNVYLLDASRCSVRRLFSTLRVMQVRKQDPSPETVGNPYYTLSETYSRLFDKIEDLVDRSIELRWESEELSIQNLKYGPSSFYYIAHGIEDTLYRADKLLDDVRWTISLNYSYKHEMLSCQYYNNYFKRNLESYYRTNISIPCNFIKHNRSNIKSFDQYIRFSNHMQFLYRFFMQDLRGTTYNILEDPKCGQKIFSLSAYLWLLVSFIYRISDDLSRTINAETSSIPEDEANAVGKRFPKIVSKIISVPPYAFSDLDIFRKNLFHVPAVPAEVPLRRNHIFGSIGRPWTNEERFFDAGRSMVVIPGTTATMPNAALTLLHWRDE